MSEQLFLIHPLTTAWIGEGKMDVTGFSDPMVFFTRWQFVQKDQNTKALSWKQEIQIAGHAEMLINHYSIFNVTSKGFAIRLENDLWGMMEGKGILESDFIGWEFSHPGFHGFEWYRLDAETKNYQMQGEFITLSEQTTTKVNGMLWKKKNADEKERVQ